MNAPAGLECLEDVKLLIWRPRGVLDEAALDKISAFVVLQEGRFGRSFNRFTDLFQVDAVDVTFKYIFHFALYRRLARLGREPLKSAILVTTPAVARYAKLHAIVTHRSALNVSIFKEYERAAEWLDVPVELLRGQA